jgi:hypothetical protein
MTVNLGEIHRQGVGSNHLQPGVLFEI